MVVTTGGGFELFGGRSLGFTVSPPMGWGGKSLGFTLSPPMGCGVEGVGVELWKKGKYLARVDAKVVSEDVVVGVVEVVDFCCCCNLYQSQANQAANISKMTTTIPMVYGVKIAKEVDAGDDGTEEEGEEGEEEEGGGAGEGGAEEVDREGDKDGKFVEEDRPKVCRSRLILSVEVFCIKSISIN
jgi:hypothetical protein